MSPCNSKKKCKKKKNKKKNPAKETKQSKATSKNEGKKKRKERDPSQTQSRCCSSRHTREKSIADPSLSQLSASHTQTGNGHTNAATVATQNPSLAQIHGQMMKTKSMKEYLSKQLI